MKKILIITLEFPPTVGGIASYVQDLARTFLEDRVVVLAPARTDGGKDEVNEAFQLMRYPLLYPRFFWPRWLRLFFLVRRIVKTEQIQVIHVHHVLPVGYVAVLMKILYKIPFVLFSHGTDIARLYSKSWKRFWARQVAGRAEQIVVNSQSLGRRLLEVFPVLEQRVTVVYPWPNAQFFVSPSSARLQLLSDQYALSGKQVILSVSRLVDGKGFPHLIRILPKLLEHNPHLVWFIIGDGPKRAEIITEIQKNNLQNVVRFIGSVPHEQLVEFFYLSDVFVLLTHPDDVGNEEGLGLVFLEAAAAGLPVVAGRSGGVEEAVVHGQTGYVFDIHSQEKLLIEALGDLLNNPEKCRELGEHGRTRMQTEFQKENQIKKIWR